MADNLGPGALTLASRNVLVSTNLIQPLEDFGAVDDQADGKALQRRPNSSQPPAPEWPGAHLVPELHRLQVQHEPCNRAAKTSERGERAREATAPDCRSLKRLAVLLGQPKALAIRVLPGVCRRTLIFQVPVKYF